MSRRYFVAFKNLHNLNGETENLKETSIQKIEESESHYFESQNQSSQNQMKESKLEKLPCKIINCLLIILLFVMLFNLLFNGSGY